MKRLGLLALAVALCVPAWAQFDKVDVQPKGENGLLGGGTSRTPDLSGANGPVLNLAPLGTPAYGVLPGVAPDLSIGAIPRLPASAVEGGIQVFSHPGVRAQARLAPLVQAGLRAAQARVGGRPIGVLSLAPGAAAPRVSAGRLLNEAVSPAVGGAAPTPGPSSDQALSGSVARQRAFWDAASEQPAVADAAPAFAPQGAFRDAVAGGVPAGLPAAARLAAPAPALWRAPLAPALGARPGAAAAGPAPSVSLGARASRALSAAASTARSAVFAVRSAASALGPAAVRAAETFRGPIKSLSLQVEGLTVMVRARAESVAATTRDLAAFVLAPSAAEPRPAAPRSFARAAERVAMRTTADEFSAAFMPTAFRPAEGVALSGPPPNANAFGLVVGWAPAGSARPVAVRSQPEAWFVPAPARSVARAFSPGRRYLAAASLFLSIFLPGLLAALLI